MTFELLKKLSSDLFFNTLEKYY